MAKPIKETPILKGREAVVFIEKMKESYENRNTPEENAKIRENFDRLNAVAQF